MNHPKVSILIPTYNMARYVDIAVRSALAQTYRDIEIIVCDNASTDDTLEVLARFNDPRLRVLRNDSNIGPVGNFNKLIELSRGDYLKFLEADDVLLPHCVATLLPHMEDNPAVVMACGGRTLIDAQGRVIGGHVKRKSAVVPGVVVRARVRRMGNEFGTPTDTMIRRSVLDKSGFFDPDYGSYLNDWDLWLRIAEHGDIAFVAEALAQVRRHPQQIGAVGGASNRDIDSSLTMIRKRFENSRYLGQKMRMYLHFSEEYLWRALLMLVKTPGAPALRNLVAVNRLIRKYLRTGYPLFLLFAVLHAPVFITLYLLRRNGYAIPA